MAIFGLCFLCLHLFAAFDSAGSVRTEYQARRVARRSPRKWSSAAAFSAAVGMDCARLRSRKRPARLSAVRRAAAPWKKRAFAAAEAASSCRPGSMSTSGEGRVLPLIASPPLLP